MHMPIVRQLSAACVATAALTASVNANAHYYGYVHSATISGPADDGASIIIKTNILHQTCNTFVQNFDTHEMWYKTDSSGNYWVEVGVYDGEGTNSIFNPCENDVIFWADSRPGGGLNVHFYNNGWSFGSYYQAEVTASGSCSWNVIFGGLALGTSTSNCPGSGRSLYAGIETTTQSSGSVQGFVTGWQSEDGSGNWSSQGWGTMWMAENNPPSIEQVANSPWGAQTEETLNEGF
jgi:hypothetical protein